MVPGPHMERLDIVVAHTLALVLLVEGTVPEGTAGSPAAFGRMAAEASMALAVDRKPTLSWSDPGRQLTESTTPACRPCTVRPGQSPERDACQHRTLLVEPQRLQPSGRRVDFRHRGDATAAPLSVQ